MDYVEEVDNFIKEFNIENEYNKILGDIASDKVSYIRNIYSNYTELSYLLKVEEYDNALKEIIELLKLERPTYLNDNFIKELNRFERISYYIIDKEYEKAYEEEMETLCVEYVMPL